MIEYLDQLDKQILLYLNGMHTPFFDYLMWYVSKTATWSLMLVVLLYLLFKDNWRSAIVVIIGIALTITFADQIASGILKGTIERFRPTHSPEIGDLVQTVRGYRGGLYGFVSSHAANTIGVSMFLTLLLRNRTLSVTLFSWAFFVSYSRIYLGVHYLGDIVGGACVGLFSGVVVFAIYKCFKKSTKINPKFIINDFSKKNANILTIAILSNLLITVGVSAFLCFVA